MNLLRRCSFFALCTFAAWPVSAQTADVQAGSQGRAQELASPALLEELAQHLWEIQSQTTASPRTALAAGVLWSPLYRRDVGWFQVVGPSVSLRVVPVGRSASRADVLLERFRLLKEHQSYRLALLLSQERTRTAQEIKAYESRLAETNAKLCALSTREPGKHAPHEPNPVGAMHECPKAGNASAATHAEDAADLPEDARRQRAEFFREVKADLERRLAALRADLAFLKQTDRNADDVVARAEQIVRDVRGASWIPYLDLTVAYTLQVSEHGVDEKLGGLAAGVGLGVPKLQPLSFGVIVGSGRSFGGYVSLSSEVVSTELPWF
jgi:hypothetical protein